VAGIAGLHVERCLVRHPSVKATAAFAIVLLTTFTPDQPARRASAMNVT
jgi:hypothetical protein